MIKSVLSAFRQLDYPVPVVASDAEMPDDVAAAPTLSIRTDIAASAGLTLDASMLNATLLDGRRRASIWSSAAALVVSRRDTLLADFDAAKATLSQEGVPLFVRDSGGTAVLQGPGIVTLSLIHVPSSSQLEASYESLRAVAAAAFSPWGIEVGFGAVDGAFCDGKYNLVVERRKFAGTAQRRRSGRFAAALVHAVILIAPDLAAMTRGINRFYSLAGASHRFSPDSCISLRDLLPDANHPDLVAASIANLARAASAWRDEA
jgi:octanoyl-[GcvH]:protein N-octanoyltransferase